MLRIYWVYLPEARMEPEMQQPYNTLIIVLVRDRTSKLSLTIEINYEAYDYFMVVLCSDAK